MQGFTVAVVHAVHADQPENSQTQFLQEPVQTVRVQVFARRKGEHLNLFFFLIEIYYENFFLFLIKIFCLHCD